MSPRAPSDCGIHSATANPEARSDLMHREFLAAPELAHLAHLLLIELRRVIGDATTETLPVTGLDALHDVLRNVSQPAASSFGLAIFKLS